MPRIPTVQGGRSESTTTGIITPSQADAGFRAIGQDLDQFAVIQRKVAEEDQRQKDNIHMSKALLAGEAGVAQLYASAVESEDYESALGIYEKASTALGLQLSQGFSNEEDQLKFQLQYMRSASSKGIQIGNRTRRLRAAEHSNTLDGLSDQLSRSSANRPMGDDVGRLSDRKILEDAVTEGMASGVITDGEKRIQAYDETTDKYTARQMSRQNPHELKRLLAEVDSDGNKANFLHLDPLDREAAARDAETGIKEQARIDDAEAADHRFAMAIDLMKRQFGVDEAGRPPPTEEEVLNSGVGATMAKTIIQNGVDIANRKDLSQDNYEVKNRVGTEVRSGRMTDPNVVLSYVGEGGLTFDTASSLIQMQTDIKSSPEKRFQIKRLNDVVNGREKPLVTNPATGREDEQGRAMFDIFRFETEQLFWKGIDEGLTTEQLLNPTSPHYVVNADSYTRTMDQGLDDHFGVETVPEEGAPVDDKARRLDESADDYLKRRQQQRASE